MMTLRSLLPLALPALGLLAFAAVVPPVQDKPAAKPGAERASGADAASGEYVVDAVHSTVIFRVKHANASWSYGRFNELAGRFFVDAADPAKCSIELVVQAGSVDTANAKRDQHLRSPDFFNTTEFPEITFQSEKVARGKDGTLEVTGPLTLHGVTRQVTATVEPAGAGPGLGGGAPVAGYEAVFTVKRSDFGIDYGIGVLGDEVRVIVSVEGQRAG